MAATTLPLLAGGLLCAKPYYVRSTPNPNHRRSILFNSAPKHFNHGSNPLNFILNRPRASTASGDTDIAEEVSSTVTFANDDATETTLFVIRARNRIGLLQVITRVFKVLGLTIERAAVEFEGDFFIKNFHVTGSDGKKIEDVENLERIRKALMEAIDGGGGGDTFGGLMQASGRGVVVKKSVPGLEPLGERRAKAEKMFGLMDGFLKNDPMSLQKDILEHVEYTVARSRFNFDDFEAFQALSHSVRDRLIERWHDTHQHFKKQDPKRLYFLSLEFLMGRSLSNSVINLGIRDEYAEALSQLGFGFEVLAEQEGDAALGNGGLARLSACQMDSLATLDYPVWGYGLRYQYGLFRQIIVDGYQHEQPDYWLNFGNPWEIERVQVSYPVKFYGTVEEKASNGVKYNVWTPGETVEAVAYDNPIPGYGTRNAINLRLWAAKPSGQYDLESYNTGDYINAIVDRQKAEAISNVLYPDDRSYQGKELRLKQQYFFVSASVQDIIRRFKDVHDNFDEFPDKVAFQINDTHPSLAIAEVMRVLIDEERLDWKRAWEIVCQTFSFTTHTVNTEGLEKIPVDLLGSLLPRHLQIMYDINHHFMEELKRKIGQDYSRIERMSIVEEGIVKSIRMANLSIICCHIVNGVSRAHFELLKTRVFKDFYDLWPQKFHYKTNGVTQRRWIVVSNPSLCSLISKWLGTEAWIRNVDLLAGLREHASNPVLQQDWRMVKKINKMRLAEYIETLTGVKVSLDAMFDVQIKRIHEYKRQLLNILGIVYRYDCIKNMNKSDRKKVVPRVCIIGGKAAPGYEVAKKIIKLCHAVAEKVNNDADVGDLLKVVFIPDYNVSMAELVIPGSDLSQHISTAGHEASGTGSMKFLLNGCLLLATADGSTVEIIEEIGAENMFLFGAKVHEVPQLREKPALGVSLQFIRVVRMVCDGYFGFKEYFKSLCDSLEDDKDFYLLGADFSSYLEAQAMADREFVNQDKWTSMSILSTAGSGRFSSDRTVEEYAKQTWGIEPNLEKLRVGYEEVNLTWAVVLHTYTFAMDMAWNAESPCYAIYGMIMKAMESSLGFISASPTFDDFVNGSDISISPALVESGSISLSYEEEFILNSRGMKLFTCRWMPALSEPKGLVFLCHGYGMECSVSMRGCGIRLAKAGYAVYGIDYIGHGKSSGLQCYIPNFDDLVTHCSDHFTSIYERQEKKNIKKILMGESMGGAVALLLHMKKPDYWDMAVLVAPMCKIAEELKPHPLLISLADKLSHLIPTWKITPSADIIDAAFRVPQIRDEIRENPLCYKGRARLATARQIWYTSLELESRLEEVSLPFLVIHGGEDRVIDPSVSRHLYETGRSSDKTFKLYPDMWHSLTCGELPQNIDIVFADIFSWLDERV